MRGWERALDAQNRISNAIAEIVSDARHCRAVAICSHGGVGALYLCKLKDVAISREQEQPSLGNYYAFEAPSLRLLHGWRSFEGGDT